MSRGLVSRPRATRRAALAVGLLGAMLALLVLVALRPGPVAAQDGPPTDPASPSDLRSLTVTNGLFGLDDAEFWTNPWKNGEALHEKHVLDANYGLFLDAPKSVQPADRTTIPCPILYAAAKKDAFKVLVREQTRLVVTRLEDRAIFVDQAIVPPDDARPLPKIGKDSMDPTSEKHSTDLAKLRILDEPGTYQAVLLLGSQASNVVRTVVERPRIDSKDPEVIKFLEARRTPKPVPPPPAPSPDLLGEPTPAGPRKPVPGAPPAPSPEGIALAAKERVVLVEDGAQVVVQGSYALKVLPKYDAVPPPPAPPEPGKPAPEPLPDYGTPRPQAVITITLVVVGEKNPAHMLVPVRLPLYAGVGAEPSVIQGSFAIDLLARQRSLRQPDTYTVYAFCGDVWTPVPIQVSTVTQAMLPKPGH